MGKHHHAGIVACDEKLILRWLHLENGRILGVNLRAGFPGVVELAIEHLDFPQVAPGQRLQEIILQEIAKYNKRGKVVKAWRSNPPEGLHHHKPSLSVNHR